ncbi:LacI family DNA-binding transcriptional regulator [Roseomonas sp. HJA6]|uniref:LacI family DNA-binding transcriptional regulator n=1 Tax=Roseomonas alba TaxID=2846776 RepID=A0ABS7AAC8_9PROT|nr:LacI family DNA-binding transcriptional regulator [Neoroseomonas alba]MBW6399253.1 LacI family DNA-binding transcriptional regulator [Neoroseomonas alba]
MCATMTSHATLGRRITIRDVAAAAGVSIGTVSRAMSGHPGILPATREAVLAAVQHLGYVPDGAAQSLRLRQTRVIGCAVPLASHPVFTAMIAGAEERLREAGYTMVLANTADRPEREVELLRFFQQRKVDGLIMTLGREDDPALARALQGLRFPVVLFERIAEGGFDSVLTDQAGGCFEATSHLLRLGHRRIALVASGLSNWPGRERKQGFFRAYAVNGVDAAPAMLHTMESPGDFTVDNALALLEQPCRPTAIIIGAQELISLLHAVRHRRLSIPADLSVISMGDSDFAALIAPGISALRWDGREEGRVAADILVERIAGDEAPSRRIVLPTRLVMRASCSGPALVQ